MTDWLRPLAPLGYLIGAMLLMDQLLFLVSQGPYDFGAGADRIRLAMLVASRLSALAIGFLLLGGAMALSGRARGIGWWLIGLGAVAVAAVGTAALALAASPEMMLPVANQQSPDYVVAAKASRLRIIITGLGAAIALAALARGVRGMILSPDAQEPEPSVQ